MWVTHLALSSTPSDCPVLWQLRSGHQLPPLWTQALLQGALATFSTRQWDLFLQPLNLAAAVWL